MKVSFDGLRLNIARSYNDLVESINNNDMKQVKEDAANMLQFVWTLLALSGDEKDAKDLSKKIKLKKVKGVNDNDQD